MFSLRWIRHSKDKLTTRNAPRIGKSGNGRSKSRPTIITANEMKAKLRLLRASADHNPKASSRHRRPLKGLRVQTDCQSKYSLLITDPSRKMITVLKVSPHCHKFQSRRKFLIRLNMSKICRKNRILRRPMRMMRVNCNLTSL